MKRKKERKEEREGRGVERATRMRVVSSKEAVVAGLAASGSAGSVSRQRGQLRLRGAQAGTGATVPTIIRRWAEAAGVK